MTFCTDLLSCPAEHPVFTHLKPTLLSSPNRDTTPFMTKQSSHLRHYLHLILFKARADLQSEANRYYISYFWWILGPVIEMLVFYLVFAVLLRRGTEHFVPFLLIGVMTFNWFGSCVIHCTNSILNNGNLIKQVRLHKIYFPLVVLLTDTFKFAIAFLLVIIFINIYGLPLSSSYLYIAPVFLTQFFLIAATGTFLSALTPFLPDLHLLVGYALRMLFFVSGVFFDPSALPENYQTLFFLNPMACIIDAYRAILIRGNAPDMFPIFIILICSLAFFIFAFKFLHANDKYYSRII
jgi:lipopolysaccharide transport system permease protein